MGWETNLHIESVDCGAVLRLVLNGRWTAEKKGSFERKELVGRSVRKRKWNCFFGGDVFMESLLAVSLAKNSFQRNGNKKNIL